MTKNRENEYAPYSEAFYNFEKFFDVSHDLFCVVGYDGYFKRINPAFSALLEYTTEELLSKPIKHFIFSDDKKETRIVRNQLINQFPILDFENRYLTKNGQIVWLLWNSIPIEEENLIYAVGKNITHKKELQLERKLEIKKLTEINNEFKQLCFSTAHDLGSPVNNMLAVFELIDTIDIQNEETLEYLTILKSTTNCLKEKLNECVKILNSKNKNDSELEEINLNSSLNEVLISINSLIKSSKTTIEIDFSKTQKINFNKLYLKSIFLNLITNAIKYAKPNTLSTISIRSERINSNTQLIISDNGIGFNLEEVSGKVFGLYQKFNDIKNNNDSNGIGLYLVHNYVTNLGGQLTLESKVNQGATFTITLKD